MLRLLVILSTLLLVACNDQSLYSELSEQESNEMVSLLEYEGIAAQKRSSAEGFSVTVDKDQFARSINFLKANGYPRNHFDSIGDVFAKEGFVSSPLEEWARYHYAQSQELTKTLENIDGVIMARVHIAMPKQDSRLNKNPKPASASVFIKHHADVSLSERDSDIKAVVVNSIEGLPYDKVTTAFFPAHKTKTHHVKASGTTIDKAYLGYGTAVFLLLVVAFWGVKKSRSSELS